MKKKMGHNKITLMFFEYKGYDGIAKYNDETDIYFGRVLNAEGDVVTFEGKTEEELKSAFEGSVDEYIEFCNE